jgi:hypothetical protein
MTRSFRPNQRFVPGGGAAGAFARPHQRLPAKPLADLVDGCIAPVLAKQGFAASDIIMAWPEIVGDRLARHAEPIRLDWPGGARRRYAEEAEPATLVVRVTGAFALELQHMAPVVIERVNSHFGWRCVARLALRQGPLQRRTKVAEPPRNLSPAAARAVEDHVADVADEGLQQALRRLGQAVLSR